MTVRLLLHVLAALHAGGIDAPCKDLVSYYCGRQSGRKNTGFTADCAKARRKGLVEYPTPGTMCLADAGRDRMRVVVNKPPTTNEHIHEEILWTLEGGRSPRHNARSIELFQLLRDGQPRYLIDVAHRMGYRNEKTTCFQELCRKERRRGLITVDPRRRTMELADFAFPFGRPQSNLL